MNSWAIEQVMVVARELREKRGELDDYATTLDHVAQRIGNDDPDALLAVDFRPAMDDLNKSWYEATRRFGPYNFHPERCEDWNLESGGNTDLGEPLVAPFSGVILSAHDWGGGIGRVIQILGTEPDGTLIAWAGWHLHDMMVASGQRVGVGERIGSIGNADGRYSGAHLHEQICIVNHWGVPSPNTFANDSRYDWRQPSAFYVGRGVGAGLMDKLTEYDGD